jgi:hypothetical protein
VPGKDAVAASLQSARVQAVTHWTAAVMSVNTSSRPRLPFRTSLFAAIIPRTCGTGDRGRSTAGMQEVTSRIVTGYYVVVSAATWKILAEPANLTMGAPGSVLR